MKFIICVSLLAVSCAPRPVTIPSEAVGVRVVAARTTWHASYVFSQPAEAPLEIASGREIHVPVGAIVTLALASGEYVADFALPDFGLHDFAAPGLPSAFQFRASREGRYEVRGGEMCGLPHDDRSRGILVVEDVSAYRAWVRSRTQAHAAG